MNEDNAEDPGVSLSMPRYEEVREQILNHSFHDIPQSDISPEFGFELHNENSYQVEEDSMSNEIDAFIKHLVLLNFNHDKILHTISCFEEFRENPPLDNLFFLHIFLFKLSTLQQQNQDFDTTLDKTIYNPITLLPDTQFPWPISEMAQFEFNNSDHLITLDRVIVVIGLPKTNDVKLLQVAHELLSSFIFTELAYVLSVNIPCKEDGVSTGCAFIEFGSFLEISIICKAIEGFKFGEGILHCRPFSDLSSGSEMMNEEEMGEMNLLRMERDLGDGEIVIENNNNNNYSFSNSRSGIDDIIGVGERERIRRMRREEGKDMDIDISHISQSPISTRQSTDSLIREINELTMNNNIANNNRSNSNNNNNNNVNVNTNSNGNSNGNINSQQQQQQQQQVQPPPPSPSTSTSTSTSTSANNNNNSSSNTVNNDNNTSVSLENLSNEVQQLQTMNLSISTKLTTITTRYLELENNYKIICQRNKHLTDKNETLIESIDHLKHTLRLITASRDQLSSRYAELSRDLDSARSALLRSSRLVDSKENELVNEKAINEQLREENEELSRLNRNKELVESVESLKKETYDKLKTLTVKDLTGFSDVVETFVLNLRKAKDFAIQREKSETQSKLDEIVCVICQKNNKNVLLLPCKHFCICRECANNEEFNNKCPICRSPIADKMIIYS